VFLASITQTVRLIRSKGVGIVFVTQTPKDVPSDVLAQLGSRVQHALRAFTPDDAKALRATVSTYPKSGYDLAEVLTSMGTGEAVVTVLSDKGIPTPVAWTRLRAPQSLMTTAEPGLVQQVISTSALSPKYGTAIDRESAYEMLAARAAQAQLLAAFDAPPPPAPSSATAARATAAPAAAAHGAAAAPAVAAAPAARTAAVPRQATRRVKEPETLVEQVLGSAALKGFTASIGKEITRSLFGTTRRR
jgi:DNA helicase HerA-like ATPase